ncbi:uncharacterized protein LOC102809813 [Saccoglossus kowalevskii]|uniref:Uncharacterized protein LOC102809813 n=1 Tax=Saccoglossus kowalevskii TaxID=10224 RepID=A0ABM0MQE0_SACKO|nr:PREDICTED: uncharacterized protein LOC102809813 [Saccoglossus kowalevskii]
MESIGGKEPLLLLRKVIFQVASELGAIPGYSVFLKVADSYHGNSYYGTADLIKDYLGDGLRVNAKDNSFLTKRDIEAMFDRLHHDNSDSTTSNSSSGESSQREQQVPSVVSKEQQKAQVKKTQNITREIVEIKDEELEIVESCSFKSAENKSVGRLQHDFQRTTLQGTNHHSVRKQQRSSSGVMRREMNKVMEERRMSSEHQEFGQREQLMHSFNNNVGVSIANPSIDITSGAMRIENVMSLSHAVVPISVSQADTQADVFAGGTHSQMLSLPNTVNNRDQSSGQPLTSDQSTVSVILTNEPMPGPSTSNAPVPDQILVAPQYSMLRNLDIKNRLTQLAKSYKHSETAKLVKCKICCKYFSSRPLLSAHMRVHRSGDKPFPCDQCQVKCVSIYNLKLHKQRVHSISDKAHPCPGCGKTFRLHIDRNNHYRHYCKVKKAISKFDPSGTSKKS